MPRLRLVSSPVVKNDGFTLTSSTETSTTNVERKPQLQTENSYSSGQQDIGEPLPQFVKHEESTNIELFYDLFFVANLATFSGVHEVNSRKMLTSYMGFFCILWFTWCQTSLFDIRFVADSWMERIAKACHLGVMVGLAVVGPNYDTEQHVNEETGLIDIKGNETTLQSMAIILVVSRFVLSLQYLHILFQVREFRHTKLPLGLLSGYNAIAAAIYLIIAFAFKSHEHSYRAFYVLAVVEMIINIAVSSRWEVLSFHRTHLVERMSLLTLYILGEGVIDVLKTVGTIVQVKSHWSSGTIGLLVASISAIYLFYMLYFDCLNHKNFGSIRQQIWAFAHFPFHVALVLALTGLAVFVKWYQVVYVATPAVTDYAEAAETLTPGLFTTPELFNVDTLKPQSNETFEKYAESLDDILSELFEKYPPVYQSTVDDYSQGIQNITAGYNSSTEIRIEWVQSVIDLYATMLHSVFTTYGFELSEAVEQTIESSASEVTADFAVIDVVFEYFFVSAGLSLILLGFLSLIMDTHKRWSFGTIIRFVSHLVIGTPLALLAIMKGKDSGLNFETTPWIVPSYTIAILLVLGFHHIKWGKNDHEVEAPDHMTEKAV